MCSMGSRSDSSIRFSILYDQQVIDRTDRGVTIKEELIVAVVGVVGISLGVKAEWLAIGEQGLSASNSCQTVELVHADR